MTTRPSVSPYRASNKPHKQQQKIKIYTPLLGSRDGSSSRRPEPSTRYRSLKEDCYGSQKELKNVEQLKHNIIAGTVRMSKHGSMTSIGIREAPATTMNTQRGRNDSRERSSSQTNIILSAKMSYAAERSGSRSRPKLRLQPVIRGFANADLVNCSPK